MRFLCPAAKFFQTKADNIILAILRKESLDTNEVILPMVEKQNGETLHLLDHNLTQRTKRDKIFLSVTPPSCLMMLILQQEKTQFMQ